MKKARWYVRSLVSLLLGLLLALGHAVYLGMTAPSPGAYQADHPFRIDESSQTWVVVPASAFGVRQYSVGLSSDAMASGLKDWLGRPLQRRAVPKWVLRPAVGQDTVSRGFGWPWVALTGTEVYAAGRLVSAPGYIHRNALEFVPARLCPGFLANGLVWGVIAFAGLSLLRTSVCFVRARWRARAGACAK